MLMGMAGEWMLMGMVGEGAAAGLPQGCPQQQQQPHLRTQPTCPRTLSAQC